MHDTPGGGKDVGCHGGIGRVIPRNGGRVYVKPNAVHFTPFAYTDIDVMDGVLSYLSDHGYSRVSVMESSTGGNFTRLVYKKIGYTALLRRHGVEPVHLDEGPTREVDLDDGTKIRVSRRLYDHLIRRGPNFYLSIPKLKTHSMAVVSLGVKNQQAFPVAGDRMGAHSHDTLHRRLAALYALTRPDFCIVEGITATAHGHIPVRAFVKDLVLETNVLVGGKLRGMYPNRTIYEIDEHNDLMSNTRYQSKLMGVLPIQLVPGNPVAAALTLLQAKLHGLNARVPPILG